MINFQPIAISDKDWADRYLKKENSRSADYNFGNLYMWDNRYTKLLAAVGGRLIIDIKYNKCPYFVFPVGSGDLRPAISAMMETAAKKDCPFAIRGVTEEQKALLEAAYPGRFDYTENRDSFDYIYSAEKLATFAGKKLHAKRNFCNRFEKTWDWDFVPLTKDIIPACMTMLGEWSNQFETLPEGIEDEYACIMRGFMHWDALGLEGGVLRAGGRIVGFTIGERTSSDTFDVHFEKAFYSVEGAYPMVCREFAKQILSRYPDIVYLNREEDMGHNNLRLAKMEYSPEYLLKKYTAKEN